MRADSLKRHYLWQWYRWVQSSMRLSLVQATKWIDAEMRLRLLREYLHFLYTYYKRRRRCNTFCTKHSLRNKYRKVLIKLHKLIRRQRKREKNKDFVISHRIFRSIFYYLKRWRRYRGFRFRYNIYSSQYSCLIALYRSSRGFNILRKNIKIIWARRGQVDKVGNNDVKLKYYFKKWFVESTSSWYSYMHDLRSYSNQCSNNKYFKRWMHVASTNRKSGERTYILLCKVYLQAKKSGLLKLRQYINNKMVGKIRLAIRFFNIRRCVVALNAVHRNIYKKRRLLKIIGIGMSVAIKKAALQKRYIYYVFKRFVCESLLRKLKVNQYRLQKVKHLCLVVLYKLQCHRHAHCVMSSIASAKNIMRQRNALKVIYLRLKSRKSRRSRLHSFIQKYVLRQKLLVLNRLRYLARESSRIKLLTNGYMQLKKYNNLHKIYFQKIQYAKQCRRRRLLADSLWKLYRSWKRTTICCHHQLYIQEYVDNFGMRNVIKKWRQYAYCTQRARNIVQRVTEMTSLSINRRSFKAWKVLLGLQFTRRLSVVLVAAISRVHVKYYYRHGVVKWVDYVRNYRLQQQYMRLNELVVPIWRGCYERHYHSVYSRIHFSIKLYKANYSVSMKFYSNTLRCRVVHLLQTYLKDRRSKRKLCLSLFRQYTIKWRTHHSKYLLFTNYILGGYKYYAKRLSASTLWKLFHFCKQSRRRKHYSSLSSVVRQMQARRNLKRSIKRLFIAIFHNKRKRKHMQSGIRHFYKALAIEGFGVLFARLEHRKYKDLLEYDVTSKYYEPNLCRRYLLVWLSRFKPFPVVRALAISSLVAHYSAVSHGTKVCASNRNSQFSLCYIRDRRLVRLAFYQLHQWSKGRKARRFDIESVKVTNNRGYNINVGYSPARYSSRPNQHKTSLAAVAAHQIVSNQVYFTDFDDDDDRKIGLMTTLGSAILARYVVYWKLFSYRSKCARSVHETVDVNFRRRLKALYFYHLLRRTRKCSVQKNSNIYLLGWIVSHYCHLLEALKSKLKLKIKYSLCIRRLKKKKISYYYHQFCCMTSSWLQQHNVLRQSARFERKNKLKIATVAWCRHTSRRRLFRPNRYKRLLVTAIHKSGNYRKDSGSYHPVDVYFLTCLARKWYVVFSTVVTKRIKHRKLLGRKHEFFRNKIIFSHRELYFCRWRYQYQLRINKYIVFKLVTRVNKYCDHLQLAFTLRTWRCVTNYKRLYTLLRPYITGVYQRNYHRELSKLTKYIKWIRSKHHIVARVRQRHRVAMKRQIFRILIRFKHIQRIHATLSIDLHNQQLVVVRWKRHCQQSSKGRRLQSFVHYYHLKKTTSAVWNNIIIMLEHRKKERVIQLVIKRSKLVPAFGRMRVKCKRLIVNGNNIKEKMTMTKVQHSCAYYRRRCLFNVLSMFKINIGYRILQRGFLIIGGNTHVLSLPRQLQRLLFTLYIHGGNRRLSRSRWTLAHYHFESKRKNEAIGCMSANVKRYRLLRVARDYHLSNFMSLFSGYYAKRRVARNRIDICRLYHENNKKSYCIRSWRDSCCGKIYTSRRVVRYYHRRVCYSYLKRFQWTLRGRFIIKMSKILLYRRQGAGELRIHRLLSRWRRRCARRRVLNCNAFTISNQLVVKLKLVIRYFRRVTNARINCVRNGFKSIKYLSSKRLLRGWRTLFKRHYYIHQRLQHSSLYLYIRTFFLVSRLRVLPRYALSKFIQLSVRQKMMLQLCRRATGNYHFSLLRAGYNCLFKYKFHRNKYVRKGRISEYYYKRRLLSTYYDRHRRHHLVQSRHTRRIMRYRLQRHFHLYLRAVQDIKASLAKVARIRKRSRLSVKLGVFLEWFYLFRKRNYYTYISEIIHRKRLLSMFNKWVQGHESSKLVKRKDVVQDKHESRIKLEYFQYIKFICLYKKRVVSRMQSRKLFNALRRLDVFVTACFIRQKDVRVGSKHFISFMKWKHLLRWSTEQKRKKLCHSFMQQITRKVGMKCRNKTFYYLMSMLCSKCELHRRSVKLLHSSSKAWRLKWSKAFFSVLFQQICYKKMKLASYYVLQWRRYSNYSRLRRESFVLKVNKVYTCSYFAQLRSYANYQVFKKMAILYLKLSRRRNYLRLWIVAYQRTVRARVKLMDIFYTVRKYSLKYAFISWRISAQHLVRLQQLHSSRLTFLAFRQWLALKNAVSHRKKATLRAYFRRLKLVKILVYRKQQQLLRKRKFYKIFSAILHRYSSKKLTKFFYRWKNVLLP